MTVPTDLPVLQPEDAAAWERWLEENHEMSQGVWLKLAKRGTQARTVSYAEAVDLALCFGWIDGRKAALDDSFWLQRFTPRGPRSTWSQVNREKAERLIADGRMRPAGLGQVEAARADGRLDDAYAPQSTATVPEDLRSALARNPQASDFFDTLSSANRYALLYRLHHTKKPDARARRIAEFVAMLAEGRTIHPQSRRGRAAGPQGRPVSRSERRH
jgi:uncharacterized protein YdeI (YjbR/CyaY-like superfamily)